MKKLVISPQAGFGNRLRALSTGIMLAELTGRAPFHFWTPDPARSHLPHVNDMKDMGPGDVFDLDVPLFDGEAVDVCFTEWLPHHPWYAEQSTAQASLTCGQVLQLEDLQGVIACDADTVLIETSLELIAPHLAQFRQALMHDVYRRRLRLNARWSRIFETLPVFDNAVAIRRRDFLFYNPDADVAVEEVARRLRGLSGSVIVFSDDAGYEAALRAQVGAPLGVVRQESGLEGRDAYIAQFLVLSKARRVLGTRDSSFAEQAALFGGKPYQPI